MAFYSDLAETYDALFPVSAAQQQMFDFLLGEKVERVIDAGCGTGAQLLHFAAAGVACVGFDPDPVLVSIARRKLAPYPKARVFEGGFSDMARLAAPGADLVLCLGNSLVHIPRDEAARFFADAAALLAPGARLLLQILNYERLHREQVSELAPIRAEGGVAELRRFYLWEGPRKVRFRTRLVLARGGLPAVRENEIFLYPLFPAELRAMAARAGFGEILFFGDFARNEFARDSEALVCLARRT